MYSVLSAIDQLLTHKQYVCMSKLRTCRRAWTKGKTQTKICGP